ncbi:MAG: hypothetical protein J5822_07980 [Eubacteriaceae bacterium]|nr:hypothetical protein [Eubacteriaceae bacterium]
MENISEAYMKCVREDTSLREELSGINETFGREALIYGKDPVRFLNVPLITDGKMYRDLEAIASTAYGILEKIAKGFVTDPSFREMFGFPKIINRMMIAPAGYSCTIPVMRLDLFYDEQTGSARFCEVNTDGTGSMKETMDINNAFMETKAFEEFTKDHPLRCISLYDELVDSILEVYSDFEYRIDEPVIAIADYPENASVPEISVIKSQFEARGYRCIIATVTEFSYRHRYLYYGDTRVDLVYRRATTGEIAERITESEAFIKNALDGRTAVIGHFITQAANNKMLFALLSKKAVTDLLTEEENAFVREHFPFTTQLKSGNYDYNEVLHNKDAWVVKPKDLYNASHVHVGCDLSQEEWEEALSEGLENDYLLQEFCAPYKKPNSFFDGDGNLVEDLFGTMIGLYMFNGRLCGLLARASRKGIISAKDGGFTMGTFLLEE